jgi:hypothetical protein
MQSATEDVMRRWSDGRTLALAAVMITALAATGGCAHAGSSGAGGGGGDNAYEAVVSLRPDSTLRIARTQLEHHNYKVSDAGPDAIVTVPAPIPAYLQDKSGATKERYWMLRVSATSQAFRGGTRLTVVGYVLPSASRAAGATAAPQEATVVTSANRALFDEVKAAGRWIEDEAKRTRRR